MAGDEKIKVTLEADASQLTAEFRKARREVVELGQRELPQLTREILRAEERGRLLTKGLRDQTSASKQAGQGLLQLAFFADDLQYGFKGILNNIPSIIAALGAGAGLAGAISLAVLAGYKLLPILKELYTENDAGKIQAVADATAKRFAVELSQLNTLEREVEVRERAIALTRDLASYAERELRVHSQKLQAFEDQTKALELQRRLQDDLTRARTALGASQAGLQGPDAAGDLSRAAEDQVRALREKRLAEDVERAREESKLANAEAERVEVDSANLRQSAAARLRETEAEIARLRRNLASAEAAVAGNEEAVKQGLEGGLAARDQSVRRRDAEKVALEQQEALLVQLRDRQKEIEEKAQATLRPLYDQIDAAERRKRQLEAERENLQKINELERERAKIEAIRAIDAPLNDQEVLLKELPKLLAAADKRQREEEQARKKLTEQTGARREFAEEMAVLRFRASGRSRQAELLEKEVRLRREAEQVAKRLGISEAQAVRLVRERVTLEERVARGDRGAGPSRIRRSEGIQLGDGDRRRLESSRGLDRPRGLSRSAERVLNRERALPDQSGARAAASYYERSLQNEAKIIEIFQNLGVI